MAPRSLSVDGLAMVAISIMGVCTLYRLVPDADMNCLGLFFDSVKQQSSSWPNSSLSTRHQILRVQSMRHNNGTNTHACRKPWLTPNQPEHCSTACYDQRWHRPSRYQQNTRANSGYSKVSIRAFCWPANEYLRQWRLGLERSRSANTAAAGWSPYGIPWCPEVPGGASTTKETMVRKDSSFVSGAASLGA